MAAQACNPSTQEAVAGGMEGQEILNKTKTKTTIKRKYLKFLFMK